jgi:hypothetical protein
MIPGIALFVFKDKVNKNGEVKIYIRFTNNRRCSYICTNILIPIKYWDKKRQRVKSSFGLVNAIKYLDMVSGRTKRLTYAVMLTDSLYVAKYPSLKLVIMHERTVELAFEHHRWHDRTRFFNETELVANFKAKNQLD